MSKSFGPTDGPVKPLDKLIEPWKTTVSFEPTLSANVELRRSGAAAVVERLISRLEIVAEKGPPTTALGRKRIS